MKTIVYIDGQNFLYKVAEVLIEAGEVVDKQEVTALDIRYLLEQVIDGDFDVRFYGVKKIRRRYDLGNEILNKSIKFSDNLRKLRNNLQKNDVQYVEVGRLKIRDSDKCKTCGAQDQRFGEKGVDVGLAVDMVKDALLNNIERIVLVSSDVDLIPAVLAVKDAGKQITYIGFDDKLTRALFDEAGRTHVLRDKEVVEAWRRATQISGAGSESSVAK
jgi:uncharacterized LabA/DUF88 family protein